MRASIVLLAASGMTNLAIAKRLGTTRVTVSTWRMRFATKRMDGLSDEPRPGAPRKIGDDKITEVVTATLETMPATATHWSTRSMAQASGLSVSSVHRIYWLTYDQIAALRGTAKIGAIRWVQRHKLRRQPGNDGLVRILVTPDILAQSGSRRSAPDSAQNSPQNSAQNGAAAFETALTAIREAHAGELTALREQLQEQRSRADKAEAEVQTARAEAEKLRQARR